MGQLKCPVNSVMYAVSYKRLSFSPFRPVHLTWLGHSCEVCRLRSGWRQKVVKMWKWIPGIATAFARTDLRNCRHFELLMIVRVQDLCHFNELVYTPQPHEYHQHSLCHWWWRHHDDVDRQTSQLQQSVAGHDLAVIISTLGSENNPN